MLSERLTTDYGVTFTTSNNQAGSNFGQTNQALLKSNSHATGLIANRTHMNDMTSKKIILSKKRVATANAQKFKTNHLK